MARNLMFDQELREKLRSGSESVRRTVESNFGPEGRNTMREQTYDLPLVANTGRRVLQELSVADPAENLAARLVRDAALKVAAEYGDGSIATAVLADSLLSAGHRLISAGYDPMGLRKGLYKALGLLRETLGEITMPFEEVSVAAFAASCAKNDEVAENVTKAFDAVGIDGIITVQDTQGRDTHLNLWDGARYDYGLVNMAFMNDPERKRAVLKEPYVLLCNSKINSLDDIRKILEDVLQRGASLLIIAQEVSEDVQRILAANAAKGLRVVLGKAPGHGDTRRRNMLALAAKTGSLFYEDGAGRELCSCGLEICEQIERAELDKDFTVLQGFRGSSQEMVEMLQRHTHAQLEKTVDPDEREKLMTTLSILNGKTAEILVGAVVEYEMFEKKYLYENTVRAVQTAARSGLVPGAGSSCVYLAGKIAASVADWGETEKQGALCLCEGLRQLTAALAANAGDEGAVVLERLEAERDPWRGYDVQKHEFCDLRAAGILSPRSTMEAICTVAAETAGSLWTTGAAVLEC